MSKLDEIIDIVEDEPVETVAGLCWTRLIASAEFMVKIEAMTKNKDGVAIINSADDDVRRSNAVNDLLLYWAKRVVEQKRSADVFMEILQMFQECVEKAKAKGLELAPRDGGALLFEAHSFGGFLLGIEEMVYVMTGVGRARTMINGRGEVSVEVEILNEDDEERLYEVFKKDKILKVILWGDEE